MGGNDGLIFLVYSSALLVALVLFLLVLTLRQKKTIKSLQANEQSQSSLLNVLIHDILNPILAARFSLENLKREVPASLNSYVQQAIDSVEELNRLVLRVRDLRALESGHKKLRVSSSSVNALLKSVEITFAARALSKGLFLIVVPLAVDSNIEVDPVIFISFVLNNLVDNAIKFSRQGHKIRVSAEDTGAGVEFQVRDEGVGMDSGQTASLYEGFGHSVRPDLTGETGTGIGMLQVNNYLRLAGGTLNIQSRPEHSNPEDHGTIVKIFLPRASAGAGAGS